MFCFNKEVAYADEFKTFQKRFNAAFRIHCIPAVPKQQEWAFTYCSHMVSETRSVGAGVKALTSWLPSTLIVCGSGVNDASSTLLQLYYGGSTLCGRKARCDVRIPSFPSRMQDFKFTLIHVSRFVSIPVLVGRHYTSGRVPS